MEGVLNQQVLKVLVIVKSTSSDNKITKRKK